MSKLKTTGKPRQFDTGAQRDNAEGKHRMSLVPHNALSAVMQSVRIVTALYAQGAHHVAHRFRARG